MVFSTKPGAVWDFFGHWHFSEDPMNLQPAGRDEGGSPRGALGGSRDPGCIQISRAVYAQ